jgi:carboxymethylenebutenolidase
MIGRDRQTSQGCGTITAIDRSERGARTVMSELSAERTRLAHLWKEHMQHEFQTCSTEDTLATMVEDAYVKHVPVMTGGVGHAELRQFYATHFHPEDAAGHGDDPAVTHHRNRLAGRRNGRELHPYGRDGLDAAGGRAHRKRVEVALVVIVHFRDGKLAPEHIYWDQASVLAQLGLIGGATLPV